MNSKNIIIRGAKEHNLKNIDINIPREKFVVITGLSGSGKSSLAFDTIYAEGRRRYVESLSAYARQFLGNLEKPNVDYIEGLSPAISIDQKGISKNPRSTVGTTTEIYDYLRILFARIGTPHCINCGKKVVKQTLQQIVDSILLTPNETRFMILSPIVRHKKGEHKETLNMTKKSGFVRARIDGEIYELSNEINLDKNKWHSIDIIVDRLKREFKVEVNEGEPMVEYKEAITLKADHREVYKKQSGGRGKFADIVFTVEPAEEGKQGLEFISNIKGGNVPKEFIPSVEKGFKMAMQNGPLAGYEVDSLKVTLSDGSYHDVDSDQLSFELAAKIGFKNAAKLARFVIMEPIMKLEVLTPEENMGDIVGDLNRRRGQVNDMGDRAGSKVVKANVPLSEMFGYVTSLRTLSSGRATSTMEFSHYAATPSNISEQVIKKANGSTDS